LHDEEPGFRCPGSFLHRMSGDERTGESALILVFAAASGLVAVRVRKVAVFMAEAAALSWLCCSW
jgi:hypothetical protein